jgi:hypothetical protein
MKFFLTVLAVTLALPTAALAGPADLRSDPQVSSSSLGSSPALAAPRQELGAADRRAVSPLAIQARGTDVSAPDQQASPPPETIAVAVPAPSATSFDYGAAGIGAAAAIVLVTTGLGLVAALRRRHTRRPSVVTG